MGRWHVTTTEALVSVAPGVAELLEVPVRESLDGGALSEVLAAGVCGTDVALFGSSLLGDRIRPFVFGHENVVRLRAVEDLTASRWQVKEGDRVLVEEYIPCGHCAACRAGRYRVCPQTDYLRPTFLRYGRMPPSCPGPWGGFGELLYVHPGAWLHHIPDGLADHVATLAVPLANAHRWLTQIAPVACGDVVVVVGPGSIGLCAVAVAVASGASIVALIGTPNDEGRLRMGQRIGAHLPLAGTPAACREQLHAATDGAMADIVVDATGGAPGALQLAADLTGHGARVVLSGASGPYPPDLLQASAERELILKGARGHDGAAIDAALAFLASDRSSLNEIVATPVPFSSAATTLEWLGSPDHDRPIHISLVPKEHL